VSQFAVSAIERDRQAYRKRRARRSTAVAVASTLVTALVLYLAVTRAPGWPRVRQQFFNLDIGREALPRILDGLWLNIRVLIVAELLILVFGLAVALTRTLRGPVFLPFRIMAAGYTDLFRGIPLIILLYLVGFGIPGLRLQGVPTSVVVLGTIALVLSYTAYVSEVFRAGIESVHPSQRVAARSLGLTYWQSMRLVVLPQAIRRVVPPLLNDFVALQKDCGLISVLGAVDAVRAAQIEVAKTFNFTPYVVAGLLFVAMAIPTIRLADWASARIERRERTAGNL